VAARGQRGGHAQFKQAGTLDDWRDNVAALAVGNSRLCFALSAGFAGALCWLHPNVAGGFHWSGGSSLGNPACCYATASLCGAPPTGAPGCRPARPSKAGSRAL
jgi:putative DNA primase/helicase